MLGAGFFTSQKSKEVVHTGVDQATSSVTTAGDIIGEGTAGSPGTLNAINVPITLTAGNNPVDITKLVVSYTSKADYVGNIWGDGLAYNYDNVAAYGTWSGASGATKTSSGDATLTPANGYLYYWIQQITTNTMLEQNEKVILHICLADAANPGNGIASLPGPNYDITIEVKPASGATMSIPLKTPPVIKTIMTLL